MCDCGVFIPVSNGIKIMKIHQEMRELLSKIKWHLFPDTVYMRVKGEETLCDWHYSATEINRWNI